MTLFPKAPNANEGNISTRQVPTVTKKVRLQVRTSNGRKTVPKWTTSLKRQEKSITVRTSL